jgi:hypothetical protein
MQAVQGKEGETFLSADDADSRKIIRRQMSVPVLICEYLRKSADDMPMIYGTPEGR